MKPVVKWLLGGCVLLVLVGAGLAVFGVMWLRANKERLAAQAARVREDGAAAGRSMAEPQCVNVALARYREQENPIQAVQQGVWMRGCLETSTADSTFCAGVPRSDAIVATATWRVARCAEAGFEGRSNCHNILGQVQKYCESDERARKLPGR